MAMPELSHRFQTSFVATAIRFVECNVIQSIIVCYNKEKRLWFKRSKDVPDRWFPQDAVDPDSYTFDILYGMAEKNTRQQKVSATSWFDRAGASGYEVLEQSSPYIDGKPLLCWIFLKKTCLKNMRHHLKLKE